MTPLPENEDATAPEDDNRCPACNGVIHIGRCLLCGWNPSTHEERLKRFKEWKDKQQPLKGGATCQSNQNPESNQTGSNAAEQFDPSRAAEPDFIVFARLLAEEFKKHGDWDNQQIAETITQAITEYGKR